MAAPLALPVFFMKACQKIVKFREAEGLQRGSAPLHSPPGRTVPPGPRLCVPAQQKKREESSSSLFLCAFSRLFRHNGLDGLHFPAVVSTALAAHSVRQVQSTAFRAHDEVGSSQLPGGAAALVPSCFGYLPLGYCHVDTSLIIQKERFPAPSLFFICSPKAWPGPPAGACC